MNKFCDNYVKNGVIFKDKDEQILNDWYEKYKDMEKEYALPIMMTYDGTLQGMIFYRGKSIWSII